MSRFGRWLGIGMQGLFVGLLLFGATLMLLLLNTGARLFRYEMF